MAENSQFFSRKAAFSSRSGYLALWSRYMGYAYIREPLPIGPKEPHTYRAEELGMNKLQFNANLRTKLDAVVVAGQVLVSGAKPVIAPALSRVTELSAMEGYLVLTPLFQVTELPALIDGVVTEIPDSDTCIVSAIGYSFPGAVGYGEEATGIITPLMKETQDLDLQHLKGEISGAIVIGRNGITLEALRYLADNKASGLVLGSIDIAVLEAFSGRHPLRYLGALMPLPFPIVVLQGYGAPMPATTYRAIAALAGHRGAVDGKTQLRAGVTRPELLIPLPDEPLDIPDIVPKEHFQVLQIGGKVIITRAPHFGEVAEVTAVDAGLQATAAGTRASLVTVRLAGGDSLAIPVANCKTWVDEDAEGGS